ncbi:ATP-binding cassette domain-containing protein [Variovorax sp. PCZ-1]|uniref:ATP-binding cassette domain-containing protein n=1 Tax=Variovorax sp. PCZ-1 TaxID=2835533 RepID=UPI001BD0B4D1|nr:ATP-binding cassette domain-containing protein [Variovorax sp. PCZ-1]MBS7807449.1 ATP-binding cassette domain-containing protein [Variovorax sp. PCZ-1]
MKIEVKQLSVGTGAAQRTLVRGLALDCPPGSITTLMGPSGCGKSSLLAAIAGLGIPGLEADIRIELAGNRLDQLPTSQRRIGLLFQDDLLFAHMSVRENLLFAVPPGTKAERALAADAALQELGFSDMADRNPLTLSGGQRARVSLMRTLLSEPQALLLDEPFSKLDVALREQFRQFVFAHVRRLQLPTLLVTHDAADIADASRVIDFQTLIPANA